MFCQNDRAVVGGVITPKTHAHPSFPAQPGKPFVVLISPLLVPDISVPLDSKHPLVTVTVCLCIQ